MSQPVRFYKRLDVILGVVIVLLLGYLLFLDFRTPPATMPTSSVTPTSTVPSGPVLRSVLDGSIVTSTAAEIPTVLGVMIDNHPDARPEAGLDKASVVYEAPVEGGLTRYFAIFNAATSALKVGPVRSARPYFLDWLQEYGDSSYWHSGGSPQALALIPTRKIWDANEFYFGSFYWRSTDRQAPHNLYTSSDNWQSFITRYGSTHASSTWSGWNFSDVVSATTTVSAVSFNYNSDYTVGWNYNAASGTYQRLINNAPCLMDNGVSINASNVVIQEMTVNAIDDDDRQALGTVGSGVAKIFRGGTMVRGTWEKQSVTDRTRFYDPSGQELSLVPGQTWIEVVPVNTSLTITN